MQTHHGRRCTRCTFCCFAKSQVMFGLRPGCQRTAACICADKEFSNKCTISCCACAWCLSVLLGVAAVVSLASKLLLISMCSCVAFITIFIGPGRVTTHDSWYYFPFLATKSERAMKRQLTKTDADDVDDDTAANKRGGGGGRRRLLLPLLPAGRTLRMPLLRLRPYGQK